MHDTPGTTRTVAWFDPVSGIAGDMALGALLDAGADLAYVTQQLETLGLDGWRLGAERVRRNELAATRAMVDAPEGHHHRRWRDIRAILEAAPLAERVPRACAGSVRSAGICRGRGPRHSPLTKCISMKWERSTPSSMSSACVQRSNRSA